MSATEQQPAVWTPTLGAIVTTEGIRFRVWAPRPREVADVDRDGGSALV